ncbi:hypothetical protein [Streptomyces sp. NPDC048196]|uniref:hypothetical protein n=1 Tax=Streptomyces sp. NPDC048196 TaxID=3154712 RepID=UPI0033E14FAC
MADGDGQRVAADGDPSPGFVNGVRCRCTRGALGRRAGQTATGAAMWPCYARQVRALWIVRTPSALAYEGRPAVVIIAS